MPGHGTNNRVAEYWKHMHTLSLWGQRQNSRKSYKNRSEEVCMKSKQKATLQNKEKVQ